MASALKNHGRGAGRHPLKQREIAAAIAAEIRAEHLKPGHRLPNRKILAETYQTTGLTVHRAFEVLVQEGMLKTVPRKGTYIADDPPCLRRIGLVFANREHGYGWRGLDSVLKSVAQLMQANGEAEFQFYEGIHDELPPDHPEILALADDLLLGRVVGAIFSSNPYHLKQTPVIQTPNVPRIAIRSQDSNRWIASACFTPDVLLKQGAQILVEQGCRSSALFVNCKSDEKQVRQYLDPLRACGITVRSSWIHGIALDQPEWAVQLMQLVMESRSHPDALIVTDDTFAPFVKEGLETAGAIVGKDIDVLAYCNFPLPHEPSDQMIRLGYDLSAGLRMMIEHLHAQRLAPDTAPPTITLPTQA